MPGRRASSVRNGKRLNHLPLTIETLKAAYDYLATTPPFVTFNLPESDDILFKVARGKNCYGWHTRIGRGKNSKQLIAVSSGMVGHTASLMSVMAHELLHLHQELNGLASAGTEHNAAFQKEAERVCAIHGFDPRAF